MTPASALHRRLALAIAAAIVLVMAAPFVGEIRSALRNAFPNQFSTIVNTAVGLSMLAALVLGIAHTRERRAVRYGAMALAIIIAAGYDWATGSPDPRIRAVERFHVIQYGALTFLFYRVWRERDDVSAILLPAIATFIVGIAEEGYQWFLPARVGELKDVWLNGVVIASGLLFALGAAPLAAFRWRGRPGSLRLTARTGAAGVLALAAFIHVVHLGVEIRDPEAGRFVSRFTPDELAAVDRARAAFWKQDPPLVRPPRFSREDQYMTEGLQHVQARNKAWDAGDRFGAWRENLILERYFPAVLNTPSYVAKDTHRWSAEQRADAAARVKGQEGQDYSSPAYPYPLYVWPPLWLWIVACAVAAGLWFVVPRWVTASPSSSTSSSRS